MAGMVRCGNRPGSGLKRRRIGVATTPTTPTTPSPDWQKLAAQATEFLGVLAATVSPDGEQKAVAEDFSALTGALGRPLRAFTVQIDEANKVLTVIDPPEGAESYRVGDLGPGGKFDQGKFTPNTITLKKADPTTLKNADPTIVAFTVELYDADKVLLARADKVL